MNTTELNFFSECFSSDQLDEFIGEISTMKKVGKHPNVVRLLGFCTLSEPYMMIMEFIPCGDLVRNRKTMSSRHSIFWTWTFVFIINNQLKYLRTVRSKHESTFVKANINQNSNCNNNPMKNSTSNHSQILGPLGKYLDILHSHST